MSDDLDQIDDNEDWLPITDFMTEEEKASLAEMSRALKESGDDSYRLFTAALVGNETEPHGMQSLHIQRGKPEGTIWSNGTGAGDSLLEQYNELRNIIQEGIEDTPYDKGEPGYDIGPVEQAWFVLVDDCQNLDPPLVDQHNRTFHDEWNWLMNGNAGEVWTRRKITFTELVEKVKNMIVAPPDPDAKYHWYDRTD